MNVEWVESMPLQKLKKELKGENIEEEREEGREWKELPLLQVMKPGLIMKLLNHSSCVQNYCFFFFFCHCVH